MILTEVLTVNGTPLPISGYSIDTPTDGMGQSITIALAEPDITSIPLDAEIEFSYGAIKETSPGVMETSLVPLITGGKLNGRTYSIKWVQDERGGYPGDLIEFTALSPLADRYSISPPAPIILINPNEVSPTNLIPDQNQQIRVINGTNTTYLTPVIEEDVDLNLHGLLVRAYVQGCGFSRVITNLPNMPIDRVDFTIESGYHSAVRKFIEQVSLLPLAFEYDNILYVLDPERGIPSNLPAKVLALDCIVEATQTINPEAISNAVILSYKADGGNIYIGEYPQEKYITETPTETGTPGGKDYTRQEVVRHVTEYYDLVTDELRRVTEHEITTTNYGYADAIQITVTPAVPPETLPTVTRLRVAGSIQILNREVIDNTYVGNTKQGHTRTVEALFSDPDLRGDTRFALILEETNSNQWTVDLNHPGENILKQSITTTKGLVLSETLKDGLKVYTPILDADSGALVKSDLSQTTAYLDIETIIEDLRETGVNQSNVETRIIDHLGGRPRNAGVQGRPGSRSTYLPNFSLPASNGYIRELIKDEPSVALYGLRRPSALDVGRLDPIEGRLLARRKLRYNITPPKRLTILLPGIDFSLRRGSVVTPPLRSGYDGSHIVTGLNVTASAIGTPNASRRMRLECREVTNNGA